jgi:hypothetical protein
MQHNPALNLAPFGRWTLRDKAAQRRLALRWIRPATWSSIRSVPGWLPQWRLHHAGHRRQFWRALFHCKPRDALFSDVLIHKGAAMQDLPDLAC